MMRRAVRAEVPGCLVSIDRPQTSLRTVFQPVVAMQESNAADAVIVGYEALTRRLRPDGHGWDAVELTALSAEAAEELDRACRCAAMVAALEAGLDTSTTLLVNVEPVTRDLVPRPGRETEMFALARETLRVAIEVTERALLDHPANVLRQVGFARSCGWGVAIDDVGANPDSLAMLPFIAPDIVKLDIALIQATPDREQARTVTAVMAHVERSGAVVLAEGVETEQHLEQARSFGASLFQGWLFGRPEPLPARISAGQETRTL